MKWLSKLFGLDRHLVLWGASMTKVVVQAVSRHAKSSGEEEVLPSDEDRGFLQEQKGIQGFFSKPRIL